MLSPSEVSAVLVTKGNVDLAPVLDSLIFDDVVVFDNAYASRDQMTWGRAIAASGAKRQRVVYSQDDDIIHTEDNQRAILSAYTPGVLTGCMWAEWSDGARAQGIEGGYDDLVFPGSGSIFDRALLWNTANRYLEHYPFDDFFRLWADTIIGILAPTRQLDIRFDALPCAESPDRMCNLPDAVEHKREAIRRAREIRDQTATKGTNGITGPRSAHVVQQLPESGDTSQVRASMRT